MAVEDSSQGPSRVVGAGLSILASHEQPSPRTHVVPSPPRGWRRLQWIGPGFLWMVSAAGSGELLFTPRVGALYGYALLWALLAAVLLKWFINREIGRFTVCTGLGILEGFARLPGPRHWAIWLILVPQVLVAVSTIAGLASSAATALVVVLPGDLRLYTIGSILVSTGLVLWGRYRGVERAAVMIAAGLGAASIAAAVSVAPPWTELASGLIPQLPEGLNYGELLPWLGFMLSGAAGMLWYSYWVKAKGYGLAADRALERAGDVHHVGEQDRARLRGWIGQMSLDNTVAVVGTLVVTLAFLILGAQLLRPQGLVPDEDRIAEVLGRLLGDVWGPIGFWFMILAVFVGFWDTVLTDQDGFGRMFAGGTLTLLGPPAERHPWLEPERLRQLFVVVLVTILPIALYLLIGRPVALLKLAGAIEAAHIPVVTGLTLFVNYRELPPDLRPSWPVALSTAMAGMFFAIFAILYLVML